jgi:hypothetical protein
MNTEISRDVDTLMGRAEYPSFKRGTLFCQIEIQFRALPIPLVKLPCGYPF